MPPDPRPSPAALARAVLQPPAELPSEHDGAPLESPASLPHLAICIATLGSMKALTAAALIMATNLAREVGHGIDLLLEAGPYTHWNRERLIEHALDAGKATHAIFVDCDVTFPPEALTRLATLGLPIVGAHYNMKQEHRVSTIKIAGQDGGYVAAGEEIFPGGTWPTEPFEVAALGTGLLCIDLAAIAELDRPLFPCDYASAIGEDIAFCQKAHAAGIEVWCDPKLEVGHIGDYVY